MGRSYQTIAVYQDKCDGCGDCVPACSMHHTGATDPTHSRIKVAKDAEQQSFGIGLCRQCGQPQCAMCCPSGALTKDPRTGVVNWDKDKCVNCQLCTLACPYAGITYNALTDQVMKCNFCEGDPACVKACPRGALVLKEGASLFLTVP